MTNESEFRVALDAARTHAVNMQADIANASNRFEHVRLTALAIEARNVVHILEVMNARPETTRGE